MSENVLGAPVAGWTPPPHPPRAVLAGRRVRLEPFEERHIAGLFQAYAEDDGSMWDYMPVGPFPEERAFGDWFRAQRQSNDPLYFAVCDGETGAALGQATFMRIKPDAGSIEVGFIAFSPRLRQTVLTTEAMYLMMAWAFEAGYRRYEWKCNALNRASCRAAERLGFTYEGIHRHAQVVKGRNRDSAWFSILDTEWPLRKAALEAWLAPKNFDAAGLQMVSLASLRSEATSVAE